MTERRQDDRRADDAEPAKAHAALAGSAPDDSSTLLKMLSILRRLQPEWLSALLIGSSVMFWVVVKFGGSLALALFPMVAQFYGHQPVETPEQIEARAQREAQQQHVNDSVLQGLQAIGGKLDAQGQQLQAIRGDVDQLRADQARTSKRVDGLSARQRQIRDALSGPSEPPSTGP